ncbi:MAG: hypothetical protein ACREIF_15195 [Chthoniobacterales bacterium]
MTVDAPWGAFGSLRARYFGPQPLIEDGSAIGPSSLTFDARVGWKFNDIACFYTSRLPGEPAEGVDDFDVHPAEPSEVRGTIIYRF